jgi:tetratricopeptide (TPR) repeat protein
MRRKPSALTLAGRARDAGDWEVAARLYREALDRDADNSPLWVQYGHAVKEWGKLQDPDKLAQAEQAYRTALSLTPGIADSYLQLGHVLKLQGKTDEAQAAYLRAFALEPALPDPLRELKGLGWSEAHVSELLAMLQPNGSYTSEEKPLEIVPIAAAPEREKSGRTGGAQEAAAAIQEAVRSDN